MHFESGPGIVLNSFCKNIEPCLVKIARSFSGNRGIQRENDKSVEGIGIEHMELTELFEIGNTADDARFLSRLVDRGQKHPGKDGYNGHYDEEFYERKIPLRFALQV